MCRYKVINGLLSVKLSVTAVKANGPLAVAIVFGKDLHISNSQQPCHRIRTYLDTRLEARHRAAAYAKALCFSRLRRRQARELCNFVSL